MSNGRNYNYYFLDWQNDLSLKRYNDLCDRLSHVYRININDNLAETIKNCAIISNLSYYWILSSLTDYSKFDFNQYSEKGLEPYLQVFGAGTWLCSRYHIKQLSNEIQTPEAFPDLHFIETNLKFDKELLDIVYISNGEPQAEQHYKHLLQTVKTNNKIHRVDGVQGRNNAYQAAARLSKTSWFFAVFAKLEVDSNFDWTWYPDPSLGPAHYIFNATNPVNELQYGHMAMIAYNKSNTLATEYTGLDFTMSKPHIVVPINSGIARYDQNEIITWRTAFRECLKLKIDPTEENKERLQIWLNVGKGRYGLWSTRGAMDAVKYFTETGGNMEKLKLSYEWSWLNDYFHTKYNQ